VTALPTEVKEISTNTVGRGGYESRGFKVFYNRRYFLNFRRYLQNWAEGRKRSRGAEAPEI
jgi:hypothetical protein